MEKQKEKSGMISVLCALPNSIYKTIQGVDVWDAQRDAYYFTGSNPVIVHPPCAQWSRLRQLSKFNADEKELAYHCLKFVIRNGGIFEHPAGSSFFASAGIRPTISVNQNWFGYEGKKTTWLYFSGCRPLSIPLNFDAVQCRNIANLNSRNGARSRTTFQFATWMLRCIRESR